MNWMGQMGGKSEKKKCELPKKGQPDYLLLDDRGNEREKLGSNKTKATRTQNNTKPNGMNTISGPHNIIYVTGRSA